MSSFDTPHHMYLFAMKNGKKKLAYGSTPEDALNILKLRLTDKEIAEIISDQYLKITQREMRAHLAELG